MSVATRSVDVVAPPQVVWSKVEDLRLMPQLSASTLSVDGPARLTEVGQRFEQVVRLAGRRFRSTWTLLELDPGRCLTVEGELMRGVRYGITQTVEPTDDGASRLTFAMRYELPFGVLGRLAGRLGAERRALAEADEVMAGIKRLAEADASTAASDHRRKAT